MNSSVGMEVFDSYSNGMNVYPNPSTGIVHIDLPSAINSHVLVFDMLGQVVT